MTSLMQLLPVIILLLLPSFKPIQVDGLIVTYVDQSVAPKNSRFESEIGMDYTVNTTFDASFFVLGIFGEQPGEARNYTEVNLIFESFAVEGTKKSPVPFANTSGASIHINVDYFQTYRGDARTELTGAMYHEVTRVWQWDGNGRAPSGLLTGIADYMRLKAGWPSNDWVKRGSGKRWDQGFAVTAYFLEYCDVIKAGFIHDLNLKMKDGYSDDFFMEVTGQKVGDLWKAYKAEYKGSDASSAQEGPHPLHFMIALLFFFLF